MPKKSILLEKLTRKPIPKNFTKQELDTLMGKCNCSKFSGGRGSGIGYIHRETKRIIQFDEPHPGNELYPYQIKKLYSSCMILVKFKEVCYENDICNKFYVRI